eukprot:1138677-Pelagomonas_calceolata.AAC.1
MQQAGLQMQNESVFQCQNSIAATTAIIRSSENPCRIAKYQASLKDKKLTDTGIPSAGPGSNPFYNIAWLVRSRRGKTEGTPESFPLLPNLVYFPDLKDALKSHMHVKHRP